MIRLLLALEHGLLRAGLERLLERPGERRIVASARPADALAALAALDAAAGPDLALVDLALGVPGTLDLVRALRASAARPRLLVLDDDLARLPVAAFVAAGVLGFVETRAPLDALVAAIDRVGTGQASLPEPLRDALLGSLLATGAGPAPPGRVPALSRREREVVQLLAAGKTGPEIASILGLGRASVATLQRRAQAKAGTASRAELVRFAVASGLVDLED